MTKRKEITIIEKDYLTDLQQIKETIKINQAKAKVVVNSAMIMTYYEIGTIINQRKQWENKYIERLSNDLKGYGKGYSTQNLKYMMKFASEFAKEEIGHQVGDLLIPWRTLIEILYKCTSKNEKIYYIKQTHKNGWSRSMLINQIAIKSY